MVDTVARCAEGRRVAEVVIVDLAKDVGACSRPREEEAARGAVAVCRVRVVEVERVDVAVLLAELIWGGFV